MIRLIDVVGHNFMPHKFLEFSFENRGLSLIVGENKENASASSNGTGKTALLDLVSWVLFDKTIRGIGKDDVINNKVGKDCEGHLRFEVNGHPYKVSRYRGHTKFGNNVFLYEGNSDKSYSADDNKATQARVEEILGLDFELFTTIFMFGQGVVKHFAELTDVGQKEVLERVLGIQKIDNYLKEVKSRKESLDKEKLSITPKVASIEYSQSSEQHSLEVLLTDSKEWEENRQIKLSEFDNTLTKIKEQNFTVQLSKIDSELDLIKINTQDSEEDENVCIALKENKIQLSSDLNSNRASSKIYVDEHTRLENKSKEVAALGDVDALTIELNEIEKALTVSSTEISAKQSGLNEYRSAIGEVDTQIALNKQENTRLAAEIVKMSGLDGVSICPTCKGPVSKDHLEDEIKSFNTSIEKVNAELVMLQGLRTEAVETVTALVTEISALEQKLTLGKNRKTAIGGLIEKITDNADVNIELKATKSKLDSCNTKIMTLEKSLGVINADLLTIETKLATASALNDKFSTLTLSRMAVINSQTQQQEQIKAAEAQKKQTMDDPNPYGKQITDKKIRIKALEDELKSHTEDITGINDKLEYLVFWEKAFGRSGIRSLILDSVKPILDERANYYSDILTDGTVKIKFNTLKPLANGEFRDEFNIEAKNETGSNIYKGNSGGEKRRIDICILLALQYLAQHQSNSFMNVLFLDEIFESVDDEGQDRVIELLHTIAKDVESVFVISHVPSFASSFDNVIRIVRGQGKTTIE